MSNNPESFERVEYDWIIEHLPSTSKALGLLNSHPYLNEMRTRNVQVAECLLST